MLGPSGFFQTLGDSDSPVSTKDLEIIHDSEAGFNVLYRGSKNGRFFVYKALKPAYRGNPVYEELLKKDFNIGFSLTHSGICQYYGMVILPEVGSCIVMEWIDGCSLETLIANGRISKSLAVKMIDELCDALSYMHRKQIIHRDLKPENIMVTHNGRNVKIIDFGLSDADSYNAFKTPAGTKSYASPELLAGEHIDSRSDIYSLGVIIGEIYGGFRHVAAECMRRDRSRRPVTADAVKKAVHDEWKRKFIMTSVYVFAVAVIAFGLWWGFTHISFPVREEESSTDVPSENVVVDAADQKAEVNAALSDDSIEEHGHDTRNEEPEMSDVHQQDASVVSKEKAAESIDAAALEDLFNEAFDLLQ